MEPLLTVVWIALAFGAWYAVTRLRGPGGGLGGGPAGRLGGGPGARGPGAGRGTAPKARQSQGLSKRAPRLRTVDGARVVARTPRAGAEVRAIDDPVTALAALALVLTGEDQTPTKDVERTLRERLVGLTDEVHVARAMRAAQKVASRGENPHAVIKQLAPVFERTLTARERADVVAVCEDVVSANGIISDHQSVWLRSLRRSLGFEVKG